MKKILITGGAGFIGSNFIRYLLNKYPEYLIINLDLLTYAGNPENLRDVEKNPNYTFIQGDIVDRELVKGIVAGGIDYLVNFAAESHVDRSIEDPDIFTRTNILGTQVLLDVAREYGIKGFLQISTDEVYGTLEGNGYFTEETPLAPNSPYSASKASADMLVRAYYQTYQLPVIISRCSNNYGPYQYPEKLIPLVITRALAGKELPIYGDGLQVRDWLYVKDHCRAIDLILHKGRPGEVYNIGGNNEKTNLSVVKLILKILGKSENLIKHIADRPGHDRRYAIEAMKVQQELGWKPLYTFEKGLTETINWYIENREWWEALLESI
jgi:dTDP-glucose 4,6-dehydratase